MILFRTMWNYKRQILIRWISFLIAFAGGAYLFSNALAQNPNAFTPIGLKSIFVNFSVNAEFYPIWAWPLIFVGAILLLLVGGPSIGVFALFFIIGGFKLAFIVSFIAQLCSSCIFLWYAKKYELPLDLPKTLWAKLVYAECTIFSFGLWSRIFYAYPQRTLDIMLVGMQEEDETSILPLIPPVAIGICLRQIIPTLWFESFYIIMVNMTATPKRDASIFLLTSSLLVAFTLITKIPEFIPCHPSIKDILAHMEDTPPSEEEEEEEEEEKSAEQILEDLQAEEKS